MLATPRANWFPGGSPDEVRNEVQSTLSQAARTSAVPVLVAYNLPYRDCAMYSAGGALDAQAYHDWIDAFAEGIGTGSAIVILEPDGLGIIPYNTSIYGAQEWCRPAVTDADGQQVPAPGATAEERYALLNYAVDRLASAAPNAAVYLDGTHSAWLGVGEAAYRLVTAGVERTQGFFLNASNYEPTAQLEQFGTWVSQCIAFGTNPDDGGFRLDNFAWCPSQYNADADYAVDYSPEYAASVTAALQDLMGEATPSTRFVIDTSRNGQGPWTPTADYPDAQRWCNGAWFPEQALDLARRANPKLL